MDNSKERINLPVAGLRKRSMSESEAWDLSTKPNNGIECEDDLNYPLLSNGGRGISNPNLYDSGAGYITTPLGAGVSTRLVSTRVDEKLFKRVQNEYFNLKDQINTWQGLIGGSNPYTSEEDIESVYNTFDKRISDLARGCLIRKIDFKLHADILQLLPIIKRAKLVHLRRAGLMEKMPDEDDLDDDDEDDEAFLSNRVHSEEQTTSTPRRGENAESESSLSSSQFSREAGEAINKIKSLNVLRSNMGVTSGPTQPGEANNGFTGFGTVQDEIESLKLLIDKNRRLAYASECKLEQKVNGLIADISRTETSLLGIQSTVLNLSTCVESNSVRIGLLEEKTFNQSVSVKGLEKKIMKRITNLELWMESSNVEGQLYAESNTVNRATDVYGACKQSINTMQADIANLQSTILPEKEALEGVRCSVRDLK